MAETICRWRPRRSKCATCVPGWMGRTLGVELLPERVPRAGPTSAIDGLRWRGTCGWWYPAAAAAERWAIGSGAWYRCRWCALVLGCGCRDSRSEFDCRDVHARPTRIVGPTHLHLLPIGVPTVWPHWYLAPAAAALRWHRRRCCCFLGNWDGPRMDPVAPSVIYGRRVCSNV